MQRNIARLQKEEIKQNTKEISDQQKHGKKGTNNNKKNKVEESQMAYQTTAFITCIQTTYMF